MIDCGRFRTLTFRLLMVLLLLAGQSGRCLAGDWNQILGPNRNGIAVNEKFTGKSVEPLWSVECGSGLAGVAVQGDSAILFHRLADEETLTCFSVDRGKKNWSLGFPCHYEAQIVDDNGPRAVPSISGNRVVAYGVSGTLSCVNLRDGRLFWKRSTHRDFDAPEGYFGAGSAPLIDENRVIVNVGGRQQGGVVAFDLETGKTLWQTSNELASYSAPIMVQRDGKKLLLVVTRLNLLGLDPATGKELFRTPFGSRGPTVNAALPVILDDKVFLTASYGIGARLMKISQTRVDVEWEDTALSSQYTTPILHGGLLYGIDGRQDGGPVSLICFNPKTRETLWKESGLEYATLVAADGKLLIMHSNGELRIAHLDPSGYAEIAKFSLVRGTTRALPALSEGRWFIKSESRMFAFQLR